jgi:ubiquinone/menaquinone biosynthesis C-methylase UbiE
MKQKIFEQTWWNNNLNNKEKYNEYLGWLGNSSSPSRVFIRENIKDLGIKTIADFGCGPCVDYVALKDDGYEFEYLGIDSCLHLKETNLSKGIKFLNAPVEKTGLDDNSYELAYSRHVLEHLPTYKNALTEMIRVSNKYVVHIFFIKPGEEENINFWEVENLYHNTYSKQDIEIFLMNNKKVKKIEWMDITDKENALVINLV